MGESRVHGIYPGGEGAGYAGGIMSAAMDGLRLADDVNETLIIQFIRKREKSETRSNTNDAALSADKRMNTKTVSCFTVWVIFMKCFSRMPKQFQRNSN